MEFYDIFVYFATMIGIYSILSLSLNLQYGFGGLVNFGLVAFFATGAYTGALLAVNDVPFLLGIVAAGMVSALLGFIVALPTSKLSVSYWAICTLGIGEVVRLFLLNEEWLTKGSFGIAGIPRPWEDFWGDTYYSFFYLFFVWFFVGLAYLLIWRLSNSPFGRILKAVREEDDLALAMGKPVFIAKLKTMALGASMAGIAGALYAYYITYISPSDFTPMITFLVWSMVIIGGKGNILGSIAGATIIVVFYNSTRYLKDFVDFPAETLASLRMVAIGLLIILTVLYKPDGILKEKEKRYPLD
jgi:ABC-type branched-subunit amino acid transport system permease subunit